MAATATRRAQCGTANIGGASAGSGSAGRSGSGSGGLGGASASSGGAGNNAGGASGATSGGVAGRGGGVGLGGAGASGGGAGGASTASLGCGKAGAITGTTQDRTIQVDGMQRTYRLSVPVSHSGHDPLSLVFAYHGSNQDATQQAGWFGMEEPSQGKAIFVYPQGLHGKQEFLGGNDGIDTKMFDAVVAALSAEYCVDASRIFVTGFSAGAFYANTLGCDRGDTIRAIAPIEGGGPFSGATCQGKVAAWFGTARWTRTSRSTAVRPLAIFGACKLVAAIKRRQPPRLNA